MKKKTTKRYIETIFFLFLFFSLVSLSLDSYASSYDKPLVFVQLGHSHAVNSVAISQNGKLALTGSEDHTSKLWDVETGREIRTFIGHSASVLTVAFSPDGKLALTGGRDNTAKLWDIETGREINNFRR